MFDTKLNPPVVDQAAVDHFVAKGRRLRSKAFADMVRAMVTQRQARPEQQMGRTLKA